jgi:hypothetical protein
VLNSPAKLFWVFLLLASGLLISCTTFKSTAELTPITPMPTLSAKSKGNMIGWRTVCFYLPWQRTTEPDWSIGTQIAGEVIAPVLAQLRPEIQRWRFHRRAVDDATGHTFSFIVYSSDQTAEKIYTLIKQYPTTKQLQQAAQITRIRFDPLEKNAKPAFEDTSDPTWPLAIRKTWPSFIMGVSEMWLELIMQMKAESHGNMSQRELYQKIHQQITALWTQHGQHAWLHHLNAIYGYSPLAIEF